jgi:hypothetical protein
MAKARVSEENTTKFDINILFNLKIRQPFANLSITAC